MSHRARHEQLCSTDTDMRIGIGRIRIRGYVKFLQKLKAQRCIGVSDTDTRIHIGYVIWGHVEVSGLYSHPRTLPLIPERLMQQSDAGRASCAWRGTAVDRRCSGRQRLAVVVGGSLREGLKRIVGDVVRLCARGIEEGLRARLVSKIFHSLR